MADWNDTPSGDWNDAPAGNWNEGPTVAWADEPQVDEPANLFSTEPHAPPPAVPATDEFGRTTGTSWRTEKAFGFIDREDGGSDVFCHIKDIEKNAPLTVGSIVSYRYEGGGKGGSAKEVCVEEAAAPPVMHERETGVVKGWRADKGFGFIGRDDGGSDVFCHSKDIQELSSLAQGSTVSYRYDESAKGGSAKEVRVEETAAAVEEGLRETGIVKQWKDDKGFGFIGWNGEKDAFAHKRDVVSGGDLSVGQTVSFVMEDGPKGPSAKCIQEEEGDPPVFGKVEEEEEDERLYGKVKNYDEEKGFCFIGRCDGQGDVFAHKREFQGGIEPSTGLPVSFTVESGDKGDAAKKIREEDSVPETELSDEGREFGTVKKWLDEKGFGYIDRRKGGEEAYVHARSCNGLQLEKGMCVSFVFEENDKGATATDVRKEDPERVAHVTAIRRHGVVHSYNDPPRSDLRNGYGFISPSGTQLYGAPKKYYFHMDNITTPDEYGGLYPGDFVNFIIVPARKGIQAADVTLEEEPKAEEAKMEEKLGDLDLEDGQEPATEDSKAEAKVEEAGTADEWDLAAWGA